MNNFILSGNSSRFTQDFVNRSANLDIFWRFISAELILFNRLVACEPGLPWRTSPLGASLFCTFSGLVSFPLTFANFLALLVMATWREVPSTSPLLFPVYLDVFSMVDDHGRGVMSALLYADSLFSKAKRRYLQRLSVYVCMRVCICHLSADLSILA